MTTTESHAVRNGVIATVLGGVALAILGELWPPVKIVFVWIWVKIQAFAGLFGESYSVPGWTLSILGLLALITIVRTIIGLLANTAAPHTTYVEDILFGAKWRWSWSDGGISNLWCFCPTCDSELVYDDSSARRFQVYEEPKTLFICEHCNRNVVGRVDGGNKNYALSSVEREIRRRIRTGEHSGNENLG
jgi:rRNA processing protein Krr1/Pno1